MIMLQICGIRMAMGNALEEAILVADYVIGTNDEDGMATYLESNYLSSYYFLILPFMIVSL